MPYFYRTSITVPSSGEQHAQKQTKVDQAAEEGNTTYSRCSIQRS